MKITSDRIFITWLPYSQRSQTLAESFGAQPIYLGYLAGKGNLLKIALRYFLMTLHTVFISLKRRPRLIFVMNQPVFLPLTVFLLSFVVRCQYVIDSHSGLFNKPRWSWSLPLMKYAYRRSLFSIVTNPKHADLVASWGARVEILGALLLGEEPVKVFARPSRPCLVVIGTFAEDEPIAEMLEACRQLPEVQFYVTGALKNAPQNVIEEAPGNVSFTDFQPRPAYVGLVQAMDGAIILVKNDNVMQRGAYEATSWGIPIITSDWPILRESFNRGALFVDNTPPTIVKAIRELLARLEQFKLEVQDLLGERRRQWEAQIKRINSFIAENI
jgi:glycosyltransferase involved in cell wall biosynthesis